MHEFGLAQQILEIVNKELASRKVSKVNRIKIKLGKALFIETHCLAEAFNLASKGTAVENAKLEISENEGPAQIKVEEIEAELTDQS